MPRSEPPRLLLASSSPRRRMLLEEHGIPHEVVPAGVDDSGLLPGAVEPTTWAMALAHLKARSGWLRLADRSGCIVLGADTIVVKEGEIIGKPADRGDARRIVDTLNNGTHRVVTGLCLIDEHGSRLLSVDTATVRVGDVDPAGREAYLETDGWRGKAGAYNFSERVADGWPISCEGDPTTVMGLPMIKLPGIISRFVAAGAADRADA